MTGIQWLVISIIISGFVFYDAYSKKRYNLKASVLWALCAGFFPLFWGVLLYFLFRPRSNINLTPSEIKSGEEIKCANHSGIKSDRLCCGCRYAYCRDCLTEIANKNYCPSCLDFRDKKYRFLNKLLMKFSLIFLALITLILGFVVPSFTDLYEEFKIELPIVTQVVIKISSFVWILGLLFPILILLLFENTKSTNFLKKFAPLSYVISIILLWVIPGLLIGVIVIGLFLPLFTLGRIR